MRFNTIALIIILITSSISLFVSVAYGQNYKAYNELSDDEKLQRLYDQAGETVPQARHNNDRISDMFIKCGNYLTEKSEAGLTPSVRVVEACSTIVDVYGQVLGKLVREYAEDIEVIER